MVFVFRHQAPLQTKVEARAAAPFQATSFTAVTIYPGAIPVRLASAPNAIFTAIFVQPPAACRRAGGDGVPPTNGFHLYCSSRSVGLPLTSDG